MSFKKNPPLLEKFQLGFFISYVILSNERVFMRKYSYSYNNDLEDYLINLLNYADFHEVKNALRYNKTGIIRILKNPPPGKWDARSLYFWLKFFGIEISDKKFREALINLYA